jgi:hypothetical protein
LCELEIDVRPAGGGAENLVAQRDRVVVQPGVDVALDRLLVLIGGLGALIQLDVEIADLVVEGEFRVKLRRPLELRQNREICFDRLVGALCFKAASFFLDLGDVQGRPRSGVTLTR